MLTRLSYTTKTDPEEIWRSRVSCLFASDVSNSHPTASCGALFNKEYSITNLHLHNLKQFQLIGYTDADRASSTDDRKSTSGYCFHVESCRPSTLVEEQEAVLLRFPRANQNILLCVHVDNQWAIDMSKSVVSVPK